MNCASGENPDALQWSELSSYACTDSNPCDSGPCNFDNIDSGWCEACSGGAEWCRQTGFCDIKGFNSCIEVCAGGQNPNGIEWEPRDPCPDLLSGEEPDGA